MLSWNRITSFDNILGDRPLMAFLRLCQIIQYVCALKIPPSSICIFFKKWSILIKETCEYYFSCWHKKIILFLCDWSGEVENLHFVLLILFVADLKRNFLRCHLPSSTLHSYNWEPIAFNFSCIPNHRWISFRIIVGDNSVILFLANLVTQRSHPRWGLEQFFFLHTRSLRNSLHHLNFVHRDRNSLPKTSFLQQ